MNMLQYVVLIRNKGDPGNILFLELSGLENPFIVIRNRGVLHLVSLWINQSRESVSLPVQALHRQPIDFNGNCVIKQKTKKWANNFIEKYHKNTYIDKEGEPTEKDWSPASDPAWKYKLPLEDYA